jgi:hypothetical protein
MITREKTVKEFEIVSESRPHYSFTARAETPEKAAEKLIADLKAVITEISQHQRKGQEHKPTSES